MPSRKKMPAVITKKTIFPALYIILSFMAGALVWRVAQEGLWKIEPRSLPVPVGISAEMRDSFSKTPSPNVEETKKFFSALKTRAQWEAFIAEDDIQVASVSRSIAKHFSVTVEQKTINGVNVYQVTPEKIDPDHKKHLFLHLHSGAFILGSGRGGTLEAISIAANAKIPVLSVDYRMPPGHPFPAGLNDVVAVYKHLLKDHSAKSIALGGTSSGGSLALASTHRIIQIGLEVPGALFTGSPWADLTKTGDSYYTNEGIDRMLVTYDGVLSGAAKLYGDGRDLKDPLISPVYGNFHGFPPTYLITGTRDLLLSVTVRTHRKLRAAIVEAELHLYEGVSHAEYTFYPELPESKAHYAELSKFLLKHLQR